MTGLGTTGARMHSHHDGLEQPARRSQAGQGKIGCVFWVLAFAIVAMIGYKMLPIKVQSSEFADFLEEQAKWVGNRSTEDIKKAVMIKAGELNLPVKDENVVVQRDRDRIKMEVTYVVPVEFPGYTYNWQFHHMVDRPIFIF
jgi:hypothetical protein